MRSVFELLLGPLSEEAWEPSACNSTAAATPTGSTHWHKLPRPHFRPASAILRGNPPLSLQQLLGHSYSCPWVGCDTPGAAGKLYSQHRASQRLEPPGCPHRRNHENIIMLHPDSQLRGCNEKDILTHRANSVNSQSDGAAPAPHESHAYQPDHSVARQRQPKCYTQPALCTFVAKCMNEYAEAHGTGVDDDGSQSFTRARSIRQNTPQLRE